MSTTLGQVLRLEYGKPLEDADRKPNGRFPVYGANGEKDRTDRFYHDKASIVVGRKGSAGEVNLTESKFWPLDVTYFTTFDEQRHDLRFLYYLLITIDLPKLARGVKPGINRNDVYALPIKVPALAEQRRIVELLDKAFAGLAVAKANAETNLKNARALFESHLRSVFANRGEGWLEKRLEECFRLKSGDFLISKAMRGGAYPVYGGNGIAGMHNEFNLSGDHVIIGRVGALCGNARHVTEKIWLTDNAFRIVDFSFPFDGTFLTFLLNCKDLRSYARQAAQPVISNSSLKDVLIAFPALAEQKRIAGSLVALSAEIQHLESVYKQKLAALDAFKSSLLQEVFSGAL